MKKHNKINVSVLISRILALVLAGLMILGVATYTLYAFAGVI